MKNKGVSGMKSKFSCAGMLLLSLLCFGSGAALAQQASFQQLPTGASIDMAVPLFKSRVVIVDLPTGRVAVGNPDVADVVVVGPAQLYVLGKDIGTTNVMFWSRENRLIGAINVEVVHDLDGLKGKLHQLLPGEAIEVHSAQRSIVLSGQATSVTAADAAVRVAEAYLAQLQTAKKTKEFEQSTTAKSPAALGQVINLIEVGGSQQVMLEVKIAEIARTEIKRLNAQFNMIRKGVSGSFGGVNGGATFPQVVFPSQTLPGTVVNGVLVPGVTIPGGRQAILPGDAPWGPAINEFMPNAASIPESGLFGSFLNSNFIFNLAIDAAKENNLAKILAEPTLTTLTGREAKFLSGGEFPIPVPGQNGQTTVEFKQFGVGVTFLPVVLSDGRINLNVNVSVSDLVESTLVLTPVGSTQSFAVPRLVERSASGVVELADGQTMGLAGLLNDNLNEVVKKFPGLGSLPILGALFRSQQYQKGQTELVILVTPHLAKPVARGSVTLPTDKFKEPSDSDFYIWGRTEHP